jgi:hypothetical protein
MVNLFQYLTCGRNRKSKIHNMKYICHKATKTQWFTKLARAVSSLDSLGGFFF